MYNVVELLLISSIVEMQNRLIAQGLIKLEQEQLQNIELGDQVLTHYKLDPSDWLDSIELSTDDTPLESFCDYVHVSRFALN